MSGKILKKGQINTAWKSRFFVLEQHELSYYKSLDDVFVTPDDMPERHSHFDFFASTSDKTQGVTTQTMKLENRLGYIDLCGATVLSASNAG